MLSTAPSSPASSHSFAMKMDGFRTKGDTVDAVSETLSFTRFDAALLVISIVTVFADVFIDVWVAYKHLQSGNLLYFGLTVVFILVPSWVVTSVSLKWCLIQSRRAEYDEYKQRLWLAVTLHVFQLAIVYRYLSSLVFGVRSQDKKRSKPERRVYYQLMLWEDNDAAVLRLIESFLESVPQLLLQVYILTTNVDQSSPMVIAQKASVVIGVASIAWSLVAYVRTLRFSLEDSPNVSWQATIVCYLWRVLVLAPRLTALALFTAIFHWMLFVLAVAHWLLMFAWLVRFVRIGQYDMRTDKLFFKAVLAAIYIFCFVDMAPGNRRFRYAFFYAVMFAENALLLGLWYVYAELTPWYHTVALLGSFCSFCMGIMFLIIYYLLLHPNASSVIQPESTEINIRNGFAGESREPSETPPTGRNSPLRVSLTNSTPKRDSLTPCLEAGDPCSLPGFKVTPV
ncbi:unnamed protein product [Ixodes hexagonus]